jgi:hypothetical protein
MKIIKKILLVIGGLIILLLIAALFIKKEFHVDRQITIAKPKAEVFDYLKYLKNQDHFSKWALMDPNMKKYYRGTDATVGFVSGWDSQNKDLGKGEQEIKKITDGERIDYELRFMEPMESTNKAYLTTSAVDSSQTKVEWGFDGNMAYPMNLMLVFVNMDKMLGQDLETGLNNLKRELEK